MDNITYLKDLITKLSVPIPHQWRVQSFSKTRAQATVMAYIDARDCIDVLNEHAVYGWHREHIEVDKKVYCKVGIVMPDNTIQWRSDCGIESQADKEKGQSSDSFKRACVNFGIGRFLYDLPIQYVDANEIKGQSNYPYPITKDGQRIYNLTEHVNKINNTAEVKPKNTTLPPLLPGTKNWKNTAQKIADGLKIAEVRKYFTLSDADVTALEKEAEELIEEAKKTVTT